MIDEHVNNMACLKEMTDNNLCLQVVVHCVIALLSKLCYKLCSGIVTLLGSLNTLNVSQSVHESGQSLLTCYEGFI